MVGYESPCIHGFSQPTTEEIRMKELLKALRGARLIARGVYGREVVYHYLLPTGQVLELVRPRKEERVRVRQNLGTESAFSLK